MPTGNAQGADELVALDLPGIRSHRRVGRITRGERRGCEDRRRRDALEHGCLLAIPGGAVFMIGRRGTTHLPGVPEVELGSHRCPGGVAGTWRCRIDVRDRLAGLGPKDLGVFALGDARGWLAGCNRWPHVRSGKAGNVLGVEPAGRRIGRPHSTVTAGLARRRDRGSNRRAGHGTPGCARWSAHWPTGPQAGLHRKGRTGLAGARARRRARLNRRRAGRRGAVHGCPPVGPSS